MNSDLAVSHFWTEQGHSCIVRPQFEKTGHSDQRLVPKTGKLRQMLTRVTLVAYLPLEIREEQDSLRS